MKKMFFRCNGGHYFQGKGCPFDAWTMDGVAAVDEYFRERQAAGDDLSLDSIRLALKVSSELFRRMLIIDFADGAAIFEALAPDRYVYRGRELAWIETDENLG